MIKRICSVSLALMLLMTAIVPLAAAADNGWLMFVYTENRGSLNVRSSMSTGNNVVGKLDFGTAVQVYSFFGSWALINYKNTNAYVMTRYLTYTQPTTPVTPTPAPASDTSLNDINKEFKTAVKVKVPYIVVSRPARASGWVNLRWAPSTKAEVISTCPQGKELYVIAELKNWYQVQDTVTGMVGFISRSYVSKK